MPFSNLSLIAAATFRSQSVSTELLPLLPHLYRILLVLASKTGHLHPLAPWLASLIVPVLMSWFATVRLTFPVHHAALQSRETILQGKPLGRSGTYLLKVIPSRCCRVNSRRC